MGVENLASSTSVGLLRVKQAARNLLSAEIRSTLTALATGSRVTATPRLRSTIISRSGTSSGTPSDPDRRPTPSASRESPDEEEPPPDPPELPRGEESAEVKALENRSPLALASDTSSDSLWERSMTSILIE